MKHLYVTLLLTLLTSVGFSQGTFISNDVVVTWTTAGDWIDLTGSDADGIPDSDDNVIILDGHTLTLSGGVTHTCNDMWLYPNENASGNNAVILLKGFLSGPTLNILGDLTMEGDESGNATPFSLININNAQSVINVSGDLIMATLSSGDVGAQIAFLKAGTINLGGNIDFTGSEQGKIVGGTKGGTFNFNGSSTQTIPLNLGTSFDFCNIISNNTSSGGLTIDADLTSVNFAGNLTIASGATFNDGGFNVIVDGDGDDIPPGDVSNAGTYNASGTLNIAGDFTNSGTFTSTGCNINLEGNWNNSGTYTYATGDNFTFDGTGGTSTITGATSWYELTADNTTGVTVSSGAQSIHGILDLDQGTFTSGGLVTLMSDGTSTGQMDNIGTGTFSGNLTVQRQIVKSSQSFSAIASPVSGTTLATWQANGVLFSGFPNSDYPSFPFINAQQYNESAHGSDKANGWAAATDISNPTGVDNNYKAHYVYMDATTFNLSVSGSPNTGAIGLPLSYTSSGNPTEDGWNLIGNPYPCSIDWELIFADNSSNLLDGYLVYSGEYGNYGWWDGSSDAGSGGATQFIPHSQGVWVQSSGATTLSLTESHKNTTDAGFLKSSSPEFMRIFLTGNINSFQDEALIFSGDNFSDLYDGYDITKFTTMDPDNAPTLFTQSLDGVDLAFNKVGINSISIPMMAISGTIAQGSYTLDFEIPAEFMLGACMTMEDLHTGNTIDLRTATSYTYTTSDTTTLPRFMIHIVKDFNTEVTALSCFATGDGEVLFAGTGVSGYSFDLQDGSGNSVYSGVASSDTIAFINVSGGTYELVTDYIGGCGNSNFTIVVDEPILVSADFNLIEDTVYLNEGGFLLVSNNSSGTNFAWDFGDGNTSLDVNPTYTYSTPGIFQIMLTADNDNVGQCTEVTSKNVTVMNGFLSIEDLTIDNQVSVYVNSGFIVIDFDFENNTEVVINLVDVNGKTILYKGSNVSNNSINLIHTEELSSGVYIVRVLSNGKSTEKKLIVE